MGAGRAPDWGGNTETEGSDYL
ncbi:hypothetical protein ONR02_06050 [Salmonella enterica subsp. enterica serovar Lubbock]|nr:hypothetical protein [Salmonella enterica subsp. enterica serovar Lubbock]MEA7272109.1 hypothetical protein [Salmonella enterica subsp. enterica serovar Lubbock]MEA8322867.1 hypothetical protein [Salmonella enterica subsp. enterica serovar Lubbock]